MARALGNFGRTCGVMLLWVTGIVALAAALAFATEPRQDVLRERFDCIEVQHFRGDDERHIFSQYLFRRWKDETGQMEIEAWRMAKGTSQQNECIEQPDGSWVHIPTGSLPRSEASPRYDHQRGVWQLWLTDSGQLRCIEAKTFHESLDYWDFEVEERVRFGKEKRAELMSPRGFRK